MINPRSTLLCFEGTSPVDIELYSSVIANNEYRPDVRTVDSQSAHALACKLDAYSRLWLGVPFAHLETHLTQNRAYTREEAQRKIGNLVTSAIRSVLGIDPRSIAFMFGGYATPAFVCEIINAADKGIPAIGGVIAQDDGSHGLLATLTQTPA